MYTIKAVSKQGTELITIPLEATNEQDARIEFLTSYPFANNVTIKLIDPYGNELDSRVINNLGKI